MSKDNEMVGVLVSKGFGAGWSTWGDRKSCLDKQLIALFESGADQSEILAKAENLYPEACIYGLLDCEVEYIPKGSKFRIDEYDGNETLVVLDLEHYLVAE